MSTTPERLRALEPLWGTWYMDNFIGEGSFGKVYKLHRTELGVEYLSALKWISLPMNAGDIENMREEGLSEEDVRNYYDDLLHTINDEIILMNSVKGNSNVVNYEDHIIHERVGEIGWDILIRMELLTPLSRHVSQGTFSETGVAKMGEDICRALTLCDRHKIIHRDIKPDNIFISGDGNYKLGDFGVARTMEHTIDNMSRKGTPVYMSPEVYFNKPTDRRADIYSLGLVMYRLLNNNRQPFLPLTGLPTHVDRENAFTRRLKGDMLPPPANGSRELKRVVLKACAYMPDERYGSASEMGDVLHVLLHDGSLSTGSLFPDAAAQKRIDSVRSSVNMNSGVRSDAGHAFSAAAAKPGIIPADSAKPQAEPVPADKPVKKYDTVGLDSAAPDKPVEQYGTAGLDSAAPDKPVEQYGMAGLDSAAVQASGDAHADEVQSAAMPPASRANAVTAQVYKKENGRQGRRDGGHKKLLFAVIAVACAAAIALIAYGISLIGQTTGTVAGNGSGIVNNSAAVTENVTALPALAGADSAAVHDITLGGLTFGSDATGVYFKEGNITDISALADCYNMTELSFSDNNVSDISALSKLTKLMTLYCDNNKISDISALSNLTSLTKLYCNDNSISDISALSNLTNLTELDCSFNNIPEQQIKDLAKALPDCKIVSEYGTENGAAPVQTAVAVHDITLGGKTFSSDVTELDLRNSGITDISALADCYDLTSLNLSMNNISDLSALSNLTGLTELDCGNNNISDISALSNLTSLTGLFCGGNSISDVSALSNLTNLTSLYCGSNNISDISALSNLTNLTALKFYNNDISDISALSDMTNLTLLWCNDNSIGDISALSNLTNLKSLKFYNNNISDISVLSSLTNLTYLYCTGNNIPEQQIKDLAEALPGCKIVSDCGTYESRVASEQKTVAVHDITLGGKTFRSNVTELSLSNSGITDISALADCYNLTSLNLSMNNISDLNVLSNMTNLTFLSCYDNSISDISALSNLTNLTGLSCSINNISDISALSNLTNLTVLYCCDNNISDISVLSNLTNLTELYCTGNNIPEQQIKDLAEALPNCKIISDYGTYNK